MKMRTYEEYTEKDWKKLDGYNWSGLLRGQPKFAKYCEWKKLNGWDWSGLLREQPKFKKYKKQLEKEGKR